MSYKHTQTGWILLGFCVGVLLLSQLLPPARSSHNFLLPVVVLVLLLLVALMGTLTVEVDDRAIRLRFGIGLVRKTFALADVASCQPVRNKWYWGWGIRLIPGLGGRCPHCWLYNVSGLDAVELRMKDGKIFRIGTDEARKLSDFIQLRLNKTA